MHDAGDKIAAMGISRFTRRFTAWIACVAILMASFAPSISHALAAAAPPRSLFAEICTTTDGQVAELKKKQASGHSAPVEHGLHVEHCPYCLPHSDTTGLRPGTIDVPVTANDSISFPALFYQSPHPLFVWAAAQSRAPPASS
jgi:hypothetical protein